MIIEPPLSQFIVLVVFAIWLGLVKYMRETTKPRIRKVKPDYRAESRKLDKQMQREWDAEFRRLQGLPPLTKFSEDFDPRQKSYFSMQYEER